MAENQKMWSANISRHSALHDTLFRLVTLGSDELQKQGYTRVKHEVVVGPMLPFGHIIKTSDNLWRIIAFIHSPTR